MIPSLIILTATCASLTYTYEQIVLHKNVDYLCIYSTSARVDVLAYVCLCVHVCVQGRDVGRATSDHLVVQTYRIARICRVLGINAC